MTRTTIRKALSHVIVAVCALAVLLALIGAGLVLFVLTFVVNAVARLVVALAERERGAPLTPTANLGA